jgi:hypothetical protein
MMREKDWNKIPKKEEGAVNLKADFPLSDCAA